MSIGSFWDVCLAFDCSVFHDDHRNGSALSAARRDEVLAIDCSRAKCSEISIISFSSSDVLLQLLDSCKPMVRTGMGVPKNHLNSRMAQQSSESHDINASFTSSRGERMSQCSKTPRLPRKTGTATSESSCLVCGSRLTSTGDHKHDPR
jgi:hypothetical protein